MPQAGGGLLMPKMAKIFALLLKHDNINGAENRQWKSAFEDILSLLMGSSEQNRPIYAKFWLKCLVSFHEEVVDRVHTRMP
jgi:hypothetical protein